MYHFLAKKSARGGVIFGFPFVAMRPSKHRARKWFRLERGELFVRMRTQGQIMKKYSRTLPECYTRTAVDQEIRPKLNIFGLSMKIIRPCSGTIGLFYPRQTTNSATLENIQPALLLSLLLSKMIGVEEYTRQRTRPDGLANGMGRIRRIL